MDEHGNRIQLAAQYSAPLQAPAPILAPTGYPYPIQGAFQGPTLAQNGAPVAALAGYAQGNPYPAQGAFQGPPLLAQNGAPVAALAGYAQGNPYPAQATCCHGNPAAVSAPPPNREGGFVEGCLAVFCCYFKGGCNIPSCADLCPGAGCNIPSCADFCP